MRKAMQKGGKKLVATQGKIEKSVEKVRRGEIDVWGPKYGCSSEADFLTKLKKYAILDRDI